MDASTYVPAALGPTENFTGSFTHLAQALQVHVPDRHARHARTDAQTDAQTQTREMGAVHSFASPPTSSAGQESHTHAGTPARTHARTHA